MAVITKSQQATTNSATDRDLAAQPRQSRQALRSLSRHRSAMIGLVTLTLLLLVAVFAPILAQHDPIEQNLRQALEGPSSTHLLGTDQFGRDILSRILYGARISLFIGFLVVGVSGTFGVLFGVLAGFYEGWIDNTISRLIDIALAFPGILLSVAVVTVLGPSLLNALIAVAIANIPNYARVTRGSVLSSKQNDYILAARASGVGNYRLMFKHLLPNIMAPIIVLSSLGLATAILVASSLSFLGLGAQPPTPEWGAMLSGGRDYIYRAWWLTTFPGVAIMITVLAVNLVGDGLRDVLDPRTVQR